MVTSIRYVWSVLIVSLFIGSGNMQGIEGAVAESMIKSHFFAGQEVARRIGCSMAKIFTYENAQNIIVIPLTKCGSFCYCIVVTYPKECVFILFSLGAFYQIYKWYCDSIVGKIETIKTGVGKVEEVVQVIKETLKEHGSTLEEIDQEVKKITDEILYLNRMALEITNNQGQHTESLQGIAVQLLQAEQQRKQLENQIEALGKNIVEGNVTMVREMKSKLEELETSMNKKMESILESVGRIEKRKTQDASEQLLKIIQQQMNAGFEVLLLQQTENFKYLTKRLLQANSFAALGVMVMGTAVHHTIRPSLTMCDALQQGKKYNGYGYPSMSDIQQNNKKKKQSYVALTNKETNNQ